MRDHCNLHLPAKWRASEHHCINDSNHGSQLISAFINTGLQARVHRWRNGQAVSTVSITATLSLFFTLSGRIFRFMATTTRDAVEELLQTYGETGGINYLAAAASLPSRLSIEAACTELMSLMFPGFRSEALVSSEDLADTTRIRVRHLHARLKTEICRSFGRVPPDE